MKNKFVLQTVVLISLLITSCKNRDVTDTKILEHTGNQEIISDMQSSKKESTSSTTEIIILTKKGNGIIKTVNSNMLDLSISSTDYLQHDIVGIENLEHLTNLRSISFYNIRSIEDFSFLKQSISLRYLHIASCTVSDLKFIKDLKNLEYLCLNIYVPESAFRNMQTTKIDFSQLKQLNYIEFNANKYLGIPPFINVQNRPFINLNNNRIESINDYEKKLLLQYSTISLYFNPIAMNNIEKRKLKRMDVKYDINDKWPDRIIKYTKGPWN